MGRGDSFVFVLDQNSHAQILYLHAGGDKTVETLCIIEITVVYP